MQDDIARAENDIPWSTRHTWPTHALQVIELLRKRFVSLHKREEPHQQTGVHFIEESGPPSRYHVGRARLGYFILVTRSRRSRRLADEGTSFAIHRAQEQRKTITEMIGADRIVTLANWNKTHPSFWGSLLERFSPPGI